MQEHKETKKAAGPAAGQYSRKGKQSISIEGGRTIAPLTVPELTKPQELYLKAVFELMQDVDLGPLAEMVWTIDRDVIYSHLVEMKSLFKKMLRRYKVDPEETRGYFYTLNVFIETFKC